MRLRRVALLLAVASGAFAALRLSRRTVAGYETRGSVSATSRTQRTVDMAKIGTRAGGNFAVHRARRVFASAERQAELDAAFELKTAEQIADALGNMKGALMKLGQMASYLDQGLPEPVREALSELQHNAPPMSRELAAQVIEDDLGAPPGELFAEWDPVPIASASIGQVHRAITKDDRAVAVKVQYPGVGDAIRADLENADVLFTAMRMMFPGLDPAPIIEELRDRLNEELDYRQEAENQQLFVDSYRGHPFITIPEVLHELSGAKVLTTELAEGARFSEMETWSQDEKNLAAETIYRFVFRSLYALRAFNGDPHPGNYLFQKGGHVTFLDFGLVKHFTPSETELLEQMIQTIVLDRDIVAYRKILDDVGILKPGNTFSDAQVEDYFRHFYEFVLIKGVTTITPEFVSETVRRFFDTSGDHGEIMKGANVPASFVILQRINLGLYALLAELHATADFRAIAEELWPIVLGPPSTPMGEAEAAWLRDRQREAS